MVTKVIGEGEYLGFIVHMRWGSLDHGTLYFVFVWGCIPPLLSVQVIYWVKIIPKILWSECSHCPDTDR